MDVNTAFDLMAKASTTGTSKKDRHSAKATHYDSSMTMHHDHYDDHGSEHPVPPVDTLPQFSCILLDVNCFLAGCEKLRTHLCNKSSLNQQK